MALACTILRRDGYLTKLEICANNFGLEHFVDIVWVCDRHGNIEQFIENSIE
jgi:hypothetical protein